MEISPQLLKLAGWPCELVLQAGMVTLAADHFIFLLVAGVLRRCLLAWWPATYRLLASNAIRFQRDWQVRKRAAAFLFMMGALTEEKIAKMPKNKDGNVGRQEFLEYMLLKLGYVPYEVTWCSAILITKTNIPIPKLMYTICPHDSPSVASSERYLTTRPRVASSPGTKTP